MSGVGLSLPNILPTPKIPSKVPGIFGPDYSFSDSLPLPSEVGVRNDNTISSVIDSAKAASFYIDTVGFGAPSSSWSAGFGQLKPLGVNTFIQSGETCSNGASTWKYLEGIPTGNALGKKLAAGLAAAGMPPMKGLAPGMLEDVEDALDPTTIMSSVFGTGYPVCSYVMKKVGDQNGVILNVATGNFYVDNPEDVFCSDDGTTPNGSGGPNMSTGVCGRGVPVQGRWVKTSTTTTDPWSGGPKSVCPSGYPKKNYRDGDCLKELQNKKISGFVGTSESREISLLKTIALVTGVVFAIAAVHTVASKLKR